MRRDHELKSILADIFTEGSEAAILSGRMSGEEATRMMRDIALRLDVPDLVPQCINPQLLLKKKIKSRVKDWEPKLAQLRRKKRENGNSIFALRPNKLPET